MSKCDLSLIQLALEQGIVEVDETIAEFVPGEDDLATRIELEQFSAFLQRALMSCNKIIKMNKSKNSEQP